MGPSAGPMAQHVTVWLGLAQTRAQSRTRIGTTAFMALCQRRHRLPSSWLCSYVANQGPSKGVTTCTIDSNRDLVQCSNNFGLQTGEVLWKVHLHSNRPSCGRSPAGRLCRPGLCHLLHKASTPLGGL